jgi:outer membrane protein assembly factor BamA
LGLKVGNALDLRAVNTGIVNLYESQKVQTIFVEVESKKGSLFLNIKGVPYRVLARIVYNEIPQSIIDEVGLGKSLRVGQTIDYKLIPQYKERIERAFWNRGIYRVTVKVDPVFDPSEEGIVLTFNAKAEGETLVRKVSFKGVPTDDIASLENISLIQKNKVYTRDKLEKTVEKIIAYYKQNQFPTVKVLPPDVVFSEDKQEATVGFTIQLNSRYQFQFVGNTVFENNELRELISTQELLQVDGLNRLSQQIEQKYQRLGYHFCKVKVQSQVDEKLHLNLVKFTIEEGPRVYIDKVTFSTRMGENSKNLESLFFEGAPGVLSRKIFWEEGLKEALQNFEKNLLKIGYLKPALTMPRYLFSNDRKGVELIFDIETGTQTRVHEIKIIGNQSFSLQELKSVLDVPEDELANPEKIDEAVQKLKKFYQSKGYLDIQIQHQMITNDFSEGADNERGVLKITLKEGERFYIGSIQIVGNKKTKNKVIEREFSIHTGDVYNPEMVQKTEEDISLLGLFSRVELISSNDLDKPKIKNITVKLEESMPGFGEVGFGGAYEDPRFRIRAFFSLAYRNLWGLNQTASMRNEITLPIGVARGFVPFIEYSSIVGYRAPYLLNLPFVFSAQVGLDRYEVTANQQLITRARLEEKIERKITRKLLVYFRLHRFERSVTESLIDATIPTKYETIGSTGPGFILDLRDDIYNPTKGSYHVFDLEYAAPFLFSQQNIHFMLASFRNSFYFPLINPFQFTFYVGAAYGRSFLQDSPIPIVRQLSDLSLGGQTSLRGFQPREFQPPNPNSLYDSAYYNIRFEISFPLFYKIGAAVFLDSGQLFPNISFGYIPQPRHDGIGVGLRYKTPVGPVVIDFGKSLDSSSSQIRFYFTVGTF